MIVGISGVILRLLALDLLQNHRIILFSIHSFIRIIGRFCSGNSVELLLRRVTLTQIGSSLMSHNIWDILNILNLLLSYWQSLPRSQCIKQFIGNELVLEGQKVVFVDFT